MHSAATLVEGFGPPCLLETVGSGEDQQVDSENTLNRRGKRTGFGFRPVPVGVAGLSVVRGFVFGRAQVVQPGIQARVVVPVAPLHERGLDLGHGRERAARVADLGFDSPMIDLARGLSCASSTDPMNAKSPCMASDSVISTDVYWLDSTGRRAFVSSIICSVSSA